jgi:HTH-type transcriptional regulator, competence development regulator
MEREQTFGQALRTARREQHISQRELARRIGVDFSYISKIENDRLPAPSADRVVAIADALGMPSASLLALTGKLPSSVEDQIGKSAAAQQFLLEVERLRLTDSDWREIMGALHRLRKEPNS